MTADLTRAQRMLTDAGLPAFTAGMLLDEVPPAGLALLAAMADTVTYPVPYLASLDLNVIADLLKVQDRRGVAAAFLVTVQAVTR